jgi:hypothetical protein
MSAANISPPTSRQPAGNNSAKQEGEQKYFPIYLANNKRAILYVPATITAKEYTLLKRQIETSLMVIEATFVTADAGEA